MPDTTHPYPPLFHLAAPALAQAARPLPPTPSYASPHCQQWPWHPEPVPEGLVLRQSWGWLFAADGRCLVLIDTEDWLPLLPGGTIEPDADGGDPFAALARKAVEEGQASFADPHYLGYVYDAEGAVYGGIGPCARAGLAARITHIGPAAPDPASGQTLLRLLAPAHQAVELFGWGEQAYRQADAAERLARDAWGLRLAPGATTAEIPLAGVV